MLGELDRLEANTSRLGLAAGATGRFYINGYDENGYSAPIESQDITLEYDQSVIDIQKLENGYLLVTPKVDEGASLVTATVNGKEAYLSVTVGLKTEVVSEMESLLDWRFTSARGSGVLETAEGRNGNGLKVEFDFTKSTGTRTANSHPTKPIILPGEPQSINMWVKGDGKRGMDVIHNTWCRWKYALSIWSLCNMDRLEAN